MYTTSTSTTLIILCNIASSVTLVLVNKVIMKTLHFQYALFLTFLHFLVASVILESFHMSKMFQGKRLPTSKAIYYSFMNVCSIVFMNLSLQSNSVGFYQITKLLCIPVTVLIQTLFYKVHFSGKVKLCLLYLISGVWIATVNDIELNWKGGVFGALAVVSTSLSQIFISDGQKVYGLSSLQMLHSMMLPQAVITFLFVVPAEVIPYSEELIAGLSDIVTLRVVLFSCIVSVSVNFFTIALIGATSPVSSQVVGHLKTILILMFGMIIFQSTPMKSAELFKYVSGVTIALSAVTLYTYLKQKEASNSNTKKQA
jgi:solute carrier family 35 protein E3